MAEPTAQQRQRAEDLRLMMQSSGWQHVLALMFQHLRLHDARLGPQYPDATRFDAIGRRSMLLELLQHVYTEAETPSPLDQHYVSWLTVVQPPAPVLPAPETRETEFAPMTPDPRSRRRQAGSVA